MDLATAARVFLAVQGARRHERWPRDRIRAWQARRVAEVRAHAVGASPFYRRFHAGRTDGPLEALPVLTKSELMASFDDVVTDRRIRFADVRRHMEALEAGPFLARYVVLETSGSTGNPGVFLIDRGAWIGTLASVARSRQWAGDALKPWARTRTASVTMNHPASISGQLGRTFPSWWVPLLALDVRQPRAEILRLLNDWQPKMLVIYASIGRMLADEQAAGRLAIHPRLVFTTAEVLSPGTRRRIAEVFGSQPFNRYSTSETGDLATECLAGRRMHLYEDTALVEVVDEDDRPVPVGEWGARVLVTRFANRVQPLIRYAISDQIRLSDEPCPCGRTFRTVSGIRGRREEVFSLPAVDGSGRVSVHPFVLEVPIDELPISGFQIEQRGDAITIRLERHRGAFDEGAFLGTVQRSLRDQGARAASLTVQLVDEIPRGPGGKAPRMRIGTVEAEAEGE